MKWPFVSREMYENAMDEMQRAFVDGQARLQAEALRYGDLLAKYHELAKPPVAVTVAPSVAPASEPSEVNKVIREQASESGRYDHALATHLRGYAKQMKMQGKSDDEIVGELVKWQNTETMFRSSE
jgi:hypothetical protein